jgi:DNA-directed RNA polymerase subunit RPC12/RpoP
MMGDYIICGKCNKKFNISAKLEGILECPYCGYRAKLVEETTKPNTNTIISNVRTIFKFFRKKKEQDQRDIEQIIFDIAEYHREEDLLTLYELLQSRPLYMPVDKSSPIPTAAKPGFKYKVTSFDNLKVLMGLGPNNYPMIRVATTVSNPILKDSYVVEINLIECLKWVMKADSVYGVIVQGKTSWVWFDKKFIKYALKLKS